MVLIPKDFIESSLLVTPPRFLAELKALTFTSYIITSLVSGTLANGVPNCLTVSVTGGVTGSLLPVFLHPNANSKIADVAMQLYFFKPLFKPDPPFDIRLVNLQKSPAIVLPGVSF